MKLNIILVAAGSLALGFLIERLRDVSWQQSTRERVLQLEKQRDDLQDQIKAANEELPRLRAKDREDVAKLGKEKTDLSAANAELRGRLEMLVEKLATAQAHTTELQKLENQREKIQAQIEALKKAFDLTIIRRSTSS